MGHRPIWNWLLGIGTLFSVACLFLVKYSDRAFPTGQPRTLVNAMARLASAEDGVAVLVSLVGGLLILGTVCLPPILWCELARAAHPLSGRMRALLIGQGVLGLVGTAVTTLAMALTLASFGFGAGGDPVSAGHRVIINFEVVMSVASIGVGLFAWR